MRYRIDLAYDGSGFCGWQVQPDAVTVQGTLESALSTLLREKISVTGAGRTDTGVNASCYVAHFDASEELDALSLTTRLNGILPSSIAIYSITRTNDDFHARFGAKRREYSYFIHRKKDPFASRFSWYFAYPGLDLDAMNRAAQNLLGTHDFSCFEKTGTDNKTSVCTIFEAGWVKDDETHWHFHIAADRFLRNMVRAIVGTLLEIGRGKRSEDSISELIESQDRCRAGESVPGNALFLSRIEY